MRRDTFTGAKLTKDKPKPAPALLQSMDAFFRENNDETWARFVDSQTGMGYDEEGRLVIHPMLVKVLNESFPPAQELGRATERFTKTRDIPSSARYFTGVSLTPYDEREARKQSAISEYYRTQDAAAIERAYGKLKPPRK